VVSRSPEWTVLTWNVQGSKSTDIEAVAAAIRAHTPDVVALQEVRRPQATELAHTLGMRFTWADKHWPLRPLLMGRAEGLAILTPHGLDAAGHARISEVDSRRSWRRRIAQWALVGRPDGTAFRVYNTHLSPHPNLGALRREEALRLSRIIDEHGAEPPLILAGDLNDHDEPAIVYTLPGVEHIAPPPTNPSDGPTKSLDHVLLPADAHDVSLSVPAGGADWAGLSDHLPLTVRFTLDVVAASTS
jgi:endonuclease/exonuclease/phosphatase family metal-dependent hydrolase